MSLRLIRLQITERFKPISLDFGFAYGDRSFSRKAVNNNNNNNNDNNNNNNNNKKIIIIIIITYLTRVNPSAEAVINGCPGQLKN